MDTDSDEFTSDDSSTTPTDDERSEVDRAYVVALSNNSNSLRGDGSEECSFTLLDEKLSHLPAHVHKPLGTYYVML